MAAGLFSATGPPPPPRVGRALRCELLARLARAATRFRVICLTKEGGKGERRADDDESPAPFCFFLSILLSSNRNPFLSFELSLDLDLDLDLAPVWRDRASHPMWPRVGAPAPPPVPAPPDPDLQRRIDTLALFAARNGPAFVEYTREQQRGNDAYEFLEGGEGASYFDFRLHEAVVEAARSGERHWDDGQEGAGAGGGGGGGGGESRDPRLQHLQQQQQQQQQQPPPTIDAFDLPPGLIPELDNPARTAGCRPHAPIRAEDAEAAAKVAKAEEEKEEAEEKDKNTSAAVIITPYLSARLAALEAELEAYVPGMTRADLEEKLARARGEATRGSGWEAVMRRRAAEAAAAAAMVGGGIGGGDSAAAVAAAQPGDDGRFEGPRWLDRAGVGFEYRGGGKKKGGGSGGGGGGGAAANAAAHDPADAANPSSLLDFDLATFREHQSRAYHEDGRSQRRQRREKR